MTRTRRGRRALALAFVLVLAAAVRLGFLYLVPMELAGDAADYHRLARGVVSGSGYVAPNGTPTAWRPPGYPLFLAGVYGVFGDGPGAARWVQVLVDLGTVALVVALGRRIFGPRAGIIAGLLVALNPVLAAAPSRILSESLFTALLLGGLLLLVTEPLRGRALAAGAVLGLATLTRGVLVLFPPALALWIVLRSGRRSAAALLIVGFVAVLGPWAVRNTVKMGATVPVSTQVGHTFYSSYHPPDGWRFGYLTHDSITAAASRLPEAEASRALTRATMESVFERPGRLPRLLFLKLLFFWAPFDWEILPWYGAYNPLYVGVLALAAAWILTRREAHRRTSTRREVCAAAMGGAPGSVVREEEDEGEAREGAIRVVWLPLAYFLLMALVFYGSPRLRLPVEPLLALPAGAFVDHRLEAVGGWRIAAEGVALAGLLAATSLVIEPVRELVGGWIVAGGVL